MNRPFSFSIDEYYHIYARGVDKRQIFTDERDRWRFLMLLFVCNSEQTIHLSDYGQKDVAEIFSINRGKTLVDIGAYCLMSNHFHLLIREKVAGGISLFMQKLLTAYTMYFNKKHTRRGSLFEGTFMAKPVADDEYLRYLFAYIHLNPVKTIDPQGWGGKKIADRSVAREFLQNYRFSSYQFYLGQCRMEDEIVARATFPEYFSELKDFEQFIDEWVQFDEGELEHV